MKETNEIYEQEDCPDLNKSGNPQMEAIRLHRGETGSLDSDCHVMCFLMEGAARFTGMDFPCCEVSRMQALFMPAEDCFSYEALRDTEMILLRLTEPVRLCGSFRSETAGSSWQEGKTEEKDGFRILDIHPALTDFLRGVRRSLTDGVCSKRYCEINAELLFILLKCYYPKDELDKFLYRVLSRDVAFSEYIRLEWMNFKSVAELAESMHLSPSYFTRKFFRIFGRSPYKWIESARAKLIYRDLVHTEKSLRQIASENGFGSMSTFTQFVKRELGKTPLEIKTKRAGK